MEIRVRKSFTLIEIAIALAIFSVVMVSAGGVFFGIQNVWLRQKSKIDILRDGRWAMEFMTNELRSGGDLNIFNSERLSFYIDSDGDDSSDTRVWYWRGNTNSDTTGLGNQRNIYRGIGNNINQAYNSRQPITGFIVDNPGASIFTDSGNAVSITLLTSTNSQEYLLSSQVRLRNS